MWKRHCRLSGLSSGAGRVRECALRGLCLGSRLLFDALRQTGRLAVSCVPVPPGRDRHSRVLVVSVRLSALAGSLRVCTFLYGDPDGLPGRGERSYEGDGAGGAAFVRLYAIALALQCFPRGVRWGCAPQTCAKESSTLWTLFTLRRGCAGADSPRRHPGTIGDLTGSDKRRPHCGWPGRSCGRSNIAVRTIA